METVKYVVNENHEPIRFHLSLYFPSTGYAKWTLHLRRNKEDKFPGYSFIQKFSEFNDENLRPDLPEWFYVSCKKNGISLDGFLKDRQPYEQ